MKKKFLLILTICLSLIALNSCKKNANEIINDDKNDIINSVSNWVDYLKTNNIDIKTINNLRDSMDFSCTQKIQLSK